ncbi:hypothetical protein V499_06813 [Pseudogymnoascus sp. VKM F-103]|nr:hypothetical protein V499_06813 [Pseudogymnoascus sp. VKM F-103]
MKKRPRSARQAKSNAAAAAMVLLTNPTKTVVRINQAQSLKIVQTTVSAALNTILWINDLFPDDHFETRSYSLDDPDFSYEIKPVPQTAWEKRTKKRRPADGKANVSWDFLLKGKSEKADKIWSWLEGVCDAIKRGYLAIFQISFHNGDISRDTIAVGYVMRFNYSENGGEVHLNISAGDDKVEFTTEAMQDLKNLFHRLIKLSQETARFPADPMISLQLVYNETCPAEYQPKGFVVAPDPSIVMGQPDGFGIGHVDTTYHGVGMSLVIPRQSAAHGSDRPSRSATGSNSQLILNNSNLVSTPAYDGSTVLNTQERAEIQAVREMVPLGREVGDTQRVEDTQSQRTPSDISSPSLAHGPAEQGIAPPEGRKYYFNREVIRDLHPSHRWRNGQVRISLGSAQDIDCLCTKKFDGMTVQCEICQKRQHLHCHGYLETDVMDTHVCYKCLLHAQPDLTTEMQGLCLLRQVAWVASMEQYPLKEADLAARIGYLVKDVIAVSQRLVQEKYLRKVSKPRNKSHKNYHMRSQIPPYTFIMEEKGRLFKEYFNPTLGIEKYLHEHPQASASNAKPKSEQPSAPDFRMSSMAHESVTLVPTSRPPATPQPTRAKLLIGTGPLYGIFDADDDAATPHPGHAAPAPSMDGSTQGSPSQMGGPGPRPPLGLKRKGDVLERGARNLKRTDFVGSPFLLNRIV